MFNIIYNDVSNLDLYTYVKQRPQIPVATKKYNESEIDGSDGVIYEDLEVYNDITIKVDLNFEGTDEEHIRKTTRRIKDWLKPSGAEDILVLSDNRDYYYKVKKVEISNFIYDYIYEIQNFSVTFICDPYEYLKEGIEEIEIDSIIENFYLISKPTYIISGSGDCALNINGNQGTFYVDGTTTINTEAGSIYNSSGSLIFNKCTLNSFEDLFLKPGENKMYWTSGFKVKIIPNWRII